jgi:sterol 3beta-glucosyltransferase
VATAIESIYRDLEYARSLVKRPPTDDDTDNGLNGEITSSPDKKKLKSRSTGGSGYSSSGSVRGAPSEDWSVISDQDEPRQDERRPSLTPHHNDSKETCKRHSLAAAVMSVLPDSLSPSRRRSVSPNPRP